MFRSEIGSGFEDPGGTPPPRIPRSTPPPRAHYQLNGCLTKGTCCFIAGQSNENILHNLIIGNGKKSNCDNGLAPIQPHCKV